MGTSKNAIAVGLALTIAFLIIGNLLLPQFSQTYEYCTGEEPYSKEASGDSYTNGCCIEASTDIIACTDCNSSTGYEAYLGNCHTLIGTQNNTHCYQCADFGQKSNIRGMILVILIIGVIAVAMMFRK